MSTKRYTEKFKVEAIKQIQERGYPVAEVATPLGGLDPQFVRLVSGSGRKPDQSA